MTSSSAESFSGRPGPFYVATLDFPSADAAEFISHLGFDAIAIDFEHGLPDWETVQNIVRACELAGSTPIARINPSEDIVAACLDSGITTLQLARIDSVADIERVLRQTRFAPHGVRGIGRARANRFGHYPGGYRSFSGTADTVTLIVHIETLSGVQQLPEILAVDQVRVVVIGAQDLAASLGHLGDADHPEVRSTIDTMLESIAFSGKTVGMSASTAADARTAYARGARFLLASQARLISTTAADLLTVSGAENTVAEGSRP